jgi:hypothetical protein
MGEKRGREQGRTDGNLHHKGVGDSSRIETLFAIPLVLDHLSSPAGEETGDHLKVGPELIDGLSDTKRRKLSSQIRQLVG